MRFRRFGRPRFFRRRFRAKRYGSYRSKRWNKKKRISKIKRFRYAVSKVAETKFNNLVIDGYIAGNYMCTGNLASFTLESTTNAYLTINPYNNIVNIS